MLELFIGLSNVYIANLLNIFKTLHANLSPPLRFKHYGLYNTLMASTHSYGLFALSRLLHTLMVLLALPQPLLACNGIAFTKQSRPFLPFSWPLHALSRPLQQSTNIGTQSLSRTLTASISTASILAHIRPLLAPSYGSYTLTRLFQYNTPTFTATVNSTPIRLLKLSHGLY